MAKKADGSTKQIFAIDGNEANVEQRVGSNAYAYYILSQLEEITRNSDQIEWQVLLSSSAVKDLPKSRPGWNYKVVKPAAFWTQWALPFHLFAQRKNYKALLSLGHYGPRYSPIPYISAVMDLAFLEFPRQFRKKDYLQLKEWTQYSVKNAAKVIAISEFTRSQVIKTYNKKPSDIILAYPALTTPPERLSAAKTETILRKLNISMPYFLYLGTLQPRKNVDQLVEAFTDAKMEDVQLIIAGKVGWLAQPLLEKIKKSPAQKSIILTGYVDDEQKRALYQGAMASFSLGSHEGFGIPALESMAVGTIPVIAKTGSLPEVVGKAGISIEEGDKAELIKTLEHLAKLKAKQRASMLKQGRDQVKNFSWKKSAETILEALESVSTS